MNFLHDADKIRKILVIQFAPFGDVLLTTSYFESLKRKFPEAGTWYLVKEPYHKIVRDHPFIDHLLIIKKSTGFAYFVERLKMILRVRREHFDLVIDQQNKPSSQQMTLFSGAPHRLGYADARFSRAYNLKASRGKIRYSASRKYDILGPIGIQEEPYRLYFSIQDSDHRFIEEWMNEQHLHPHEFICIAPGSPVARKKWKHTHFAELADLIQLETDHKAVLLWGPREQTDVEAVQSLMKTEPLIAPGTDLHQCGALLAKCRLLVCNDGGLNHLSVAVGTHSLALFGNTEPDVWSPASIFSDHHHLFNLDFDSTSDYSFGISPETAFEKVKDILKESNTPSGSQGTDSPIES